MFAAAGWHVIEAKYGRRLQERFAHAGRRGAARADRRHGERGVPGPDPAARAPSCASACSRAPPPARRDDLARSSPTCPTTTCRRCSPTSAGTTRPSSSARSARPTPSATRPTVIFAYTIKGWRLPFAGDSLNHSALLVPDQIEAARRATSGIDPDDPWAGFARGLAPRLGCAARRRTELGLRRAAPADRRRRAPAVIAVPDVRIAGGDQHPAGVRRHPRGAGPRPRGRRADRHRLAGRGGLDEPRRLDQPGRRLLDRGRPGPPRRQAAAGLGAGPGGPAHRARHQRDEPVHVAQPVRADRRAVRRAAGARSARSTTRSSRAASTR